MVNRPECRSTCLADSDRSSCPCLRHPNQTYTLTCIELAPRSFVTAPTCQHTEGQVGTQAPYLFLIFLLYLLGAADRYGWRSDATRRVYRCCVFNGKKKNERTKEIGRERPENTPNKKEKNARGKKKRVWNSGIDLNLASRPTSLLHIGKGIGDSHDSCTKCAIVFAPHASSWGNALLD